MFCPNGIFGNCFLTVGIKKTTSCPAPILSKIKFEEGEEEGPS